MRVSFLVPAYNEAATIEAVLDAVDALPLDRQIVVVDDGSTDETAAIVERWAEKSRRRRPVCFSRTKAKVLRFVRRSHTRRVR